VSPVGLDQATDIVEGDRDALTPWPSPSSYRTTFVKIGAAVLEDYKQARGCNIQSPIEHQRFEDYRPSFCPT
jgi:hypothetical protein